MMIEQDMMTSQHDKRMNGATRTPIYQDNMKNEHFIMLVNST